MLDRLGNTLRWLQESFAERAKQAFARRDAAEVGSRTAERADAEGHAYGVAEDEVRSAQETNE